MYKINWGIENEELRGWTLNFPNWQIQLSIKNFIQYNNLIFIKFKDLNSPMEMHISTVDSD